jgi:hypothetical protein
VIYLRPTTNFLVGLLHNTVLPITHGTQEEGTQGTQNRSSCGYSQHYQFIKTIYEICDLQS